MRFSFGKYKAQNVANVVVNDPQYIVWLLRSFENGVIKSEVKSVVENLEQYLIPNLKCSIHDCNNKGRKIALSKCKNSGRIYCSTCVPIFEDENWNNIGVIVSYECLVSYVYGRCKHLNYNFRDLLLKLVNNNSQAIIVNEQDLINSIT